MAKFCVRCGKEMNGNFCTNCGTSNNGYNQNYINNNYNQPPKRNNGCLIVILCVVCGFIGLCVLASLSGETGTDENGNPTNSKYDYTVTKEYNDDYNFAHYIEGTVTNNTDREKGYLQIEFVCYDKDGVNLGTAIDNTNNLKAHETWKFKAMSIFGDVENVDHCNFEEITGW